MRVIREDLGFTLLEILVALVLIGLLAGVLVPTVVNQMGRGETNRVVEDLRSLEDGIKSFRVDVNRWPGRLRHLVAAPTATDTVFPSGFYPTGLLPRWRGPYLERGTIPGTGLPTAAGGVVVDTLTSRTWGTTSFVTLRVRGIAQSEAQNIRLIIDGDTAVGNTASPASSGAVRWSTGDTLIYLVAPV